MKAETDRDASTVQMLPVDDRMLEAMKVVSDAQADPLAVFRLPPEMVRPSEASGSAEIARVQDRMFRRRIGER